MGSKSKTKGKTWEREVATFLTQLYGETFIRVPHSGAYVGGSNVIRKSKLGASQIKGLKGDIIPPDSWNHFNVECKNYAEFPFHQLFTEGEVKMLEDFIGQLIDSSDEGDLNLLFIKIGRKGSFISFSANTGLNPGTRNIIYNSIKHGIWHITGHKDFWSLNTEQVKQLSLAP
ncbi:MAG: hypothetical protein EXR40_05970 [Nitrosomonadaceae bacterium]|nr:hypothetical protein [Nitrosomonadaceae bacterium]